MKMRRTQEQFKNRKEKTKWKHLNGWKKESVTWDYEVLIAIISSSGESSFDSLKNKIKF